MKARLEQFRGSIPDVDAVLEAVTVQILAAKEFQNEDGYIDLQFDNLQVLTSTPDTWLFVSPLIVSPFVTTFAFDAALKGK